MDCCSSVSGIAACTFGLVGTLLTSGPLPAFYGLLFAIGVARASQGPSFMLSAQVVPPAHYGSSATWSSGAWQTASILGPAVWAAAGAVGWGGGSLRLRGWSPGDGGAHVLCAEAA